ncbi:hypothetical protein QH494_03865 [Sphingomonas sp. AR_OL41]|uniref:hypothetical protein n=1 Tax=Sphingomonas sp. AR_OL41 TaxID=3042729 RepID=UPI002480BF56|nr:hypothetical protein [Sphingomonas sp. AR_OL41]MDH7971307.1 hypothetical protein [Sphingomonas sp. AR_OL41]
MKKKNIAKIFSGVLVTTLGLWTVVGALFDNNEAAFGCYKQNQQWIKVTKDRVLVSNSFGNKIDRVENIRKIDRVRGYLIYTDHKLLYDDDKRALSFSREFSRSAFFIDQRIGYSQRILVNKAQRGKVLSDEVKVVFPKLPC